MGLFNNKEKQREKALEKIEFFGEYFTDISEEFKNDRDFNLEAIKINKSI